MPNENLAGKTRPEKQSAGKMVSFRRNVYIVPIAFSLKLFESIDCCWLCERDRGYYSWEKWSVSNRKSQDVGHSWCFIAVSHLGGKFARNDRRKGANILIIIVTIPTITIVITATVICIAGEKSSMVYNAKML